MLFITEFMTGVGGANLIFFYLNIEVSTQSIDTNLNSYAAHYFTKNSKTILKTTKEMTKHFRAHTFS